MKIFCASLIHETNTFSPIPTDLDSFREIALCLPSTGEGLELQTQAFEGVNIGMLARRRGHQVVDGLMASAEPSAPLNQQDYLTLRSEIIRGIEQASPVQAIVLFLHGAQIAESCADCEGDLLNEIRKVVGYEIPIGIEIDPHANISQAMVDKASIIVSAQEYPHTDFESRAHHLLALMEDCHSGRLIPSMAWQRVPMFGSYFTDRQPMRDFVDRTLAIQGQGSVRSISLIHGFPWGDRSDAGAAVVVVTDNDPEAASSIAKQIAREFFSLRQQIVVEPKTAEAALDEAISRRSPAGPVLIADTTDNPGGGAPGDSTHLLFAAKQRQLSNIAIGMIWDPLAAELAASAGVGSQFALRLGGKSCRLSGDPIDLMVEVISVVEIGYQTAQGRKSALGLSVGLRCEGVYIVVNSIRQQVFSPECFRLHGIDPAAMEIVIVKSHQHFVETFAEFASDIVYASPPGVVQRNFEQLDYQQISRPVWPLDSPPFSAHGLEWES